MKTLKKIIAVIIAAIAVLAGVISYQHNTIIKQDKIITEYIYKLEIEKMRTEQTKLIYKQKIEQYENYLNDK